MVGAAFNLADDLVLVVQVHDPGNDVKRPFLGIAFAEQDLARRQLPNLHLAGKCGEIVGF